MAKDTTGRAATGMGRYYMDAGWYRHTKFRGLGFDSLFLIEASVGYSLEHATDGRFPSDLEDLAVAFGLRYSAVRKAAPPLFERGIWVDRGQGEAELVGYAQHNPTKTEIEAMTEDRSKLGRLANHKRWHEKRGRVDPSCPHCASQSGPAADPGRDPARESRTDPAGTPNPVPETSHGMGWDGMGSPPPTSSGIPHSRPGPGDVAQATPPEDDNRRLDEAARIAGTNDHEAATARGTPIEDHAAYLRRCVQRRREQPELAALAAAHPDWEARRLARQLIDDPHDENTQAAAAAEASHQRILADAAVRAATSDTPEANHAAAAQARNAIRGRS